MMSLPSLQRNYQAAFLLLIGAFLFVSFSSISDPFRGIIFGAKDGDRPEILDQVTLTIVVRALAALAIAGTFAIAGIGTLRRLRWGQFLGLGLCLCGLMFSVVATASRALAAYEIWTGGGIAPRIVPGGNPSAFSLPLYAVAGLDLLIWFLFTSLFAAACAIHLWPRKPLFGFEAVGTRVPLGRSQSGATFGVCLIALCCVTGFAFWLSDAENKTAWTTALTFIDAGIFTYCSMSFHGELGSARPERIASA